MRTSPDIYKTREGNLITVGQDYKIFSIPPEGAKIWTGYDYKKQEWVYRGKKDTRSSEELKRDYQIKRL